MLDGGKRKMVKRKEDIFKYYQGYLQAFSLVLLGISATNNL